jgi:Fungal Zn(2)-Cys(6) binuclear cluster domain
MSTTTNSPPHRESSASDSKSKSTSQRVLACLFCQQRKIKCNRVFPCANCLRHRTNCVPAGLLPRERRRRFPEKELLERLRYYEGLLQQHNVNFKPLHGHVHVSTATATSPVRPAETVAHYSPSPGILDGDFVSRPEEQSDIQPKAAM